LFPLLFELFQYFMQLHSCSGVLSLMANPVVSAQARIDDSPQPNSRL
jgi:hypothetical protein